MKNSRMGEDWSLGDQITSHNSQATLLGLWVAGMGGDGIYGCEYFRIDFKNS